MTDSDKQPCGRRKLESGRVVSQKMNKTIVVEVTRLKRHPKYEKYVKNRVRFYAHDEQNAAKEGDVVEITETRPLSKTKRWRLVRVVKHQEV